VSRACENSLASRRVYTRYDNAFNHPGSFNFHDALATGLSLGSTFGRLKNETGTAQHKGSE